MGLFDFITGGPSDQEVGNEVLESYYDEASLFPEFSHASYDAWVIWLESKVPDFVSFVGQLVKSNSASTTVDQAATRVKDLANKSGGLAKPQDIIAAAGGRGDTINWSQALPEVATETISDVGEQFVANAENIRTGVFSTFKAVKYLPWILGAGGLVYLIFLGKSMGGGIGSQVGQGIKRLSEAGAERIRQRKNPKRKSR